MSKHDIASPAIGQRIVALRYDADSGYLVIELAVGAELGLNADRDGCHGLLSGQPVRDRCLPLSQRAILAE